MPWLDVVVDSAQLEEWFLEPRTPGNHKISVWPSPNSARVDARFRTFWLPDCGAFPGRWFVKTDFENIPPGSPPNVDNFGWLDLAYDSPDKWAGSLPNDANGISMDMEVSFHEFNQFYQNPGLLVYQLFTEFGTGETLLCEDFWPRSLFNASRFEGIWWRPTVFGRRIASAGWPFGFNQVQSGTVSDCFEFELLPPPGPTVFAAFNGTDAKIDMSGATPAFFDQTQITCKVRFRSLDDAVIFSHSSFSAMRFGIFTDRVYYNNNNRLLNNLPPLNQWLDLRFERGWSHPTTLMHTLWIDDVIEAQWVASALVNRLNRFGHRSTGNQWADLDLAEFKWLRGTQASPITLIDMPMDPDACDVGPLLLKGTTFNMTLPSCP